MNKSFGIVALFSYSLFATACQPDVDPEDEAAAWGALLTENALAPNALAPNALAPNALAPNALAPNALAPNALASLQAETPNGDLARQLLRYTVSCALAPVQFFAFSWTDAEGGDHDEVYWGELGIAPDWAAAPLTDDTRQRLISGCLAARVNRYGLSVVISVRSIEKPLKTKGSSAEVDEYPNIEGAFWGNLFTASPYMNACHVPAGEAIARAASRDCAAGLIDEDGQAVPCGMMALRGPCANWCTDFNGGGRFYVICMDHPGESGSLITKAVVTTALP